MTPYVRFALRVIVAVTAITIGAAGSAQTTEYVLGLPDR